MNNFHPKFSKLTTDEQFELIYWHTVFQSNFYFIFSIDHLFLYIHFQASKFYLSNQIILYLSTYIVSFTFDNSLSFSHINLLTTVFILYIILLISYFPCLILLYFCLNQILFNLRVMAFHTYIHPLHLLDI